MSGGSSKASPTIRAVRPGGARLPFFYGWVLVAVAFVTMAVGVNARTAFSLLFPAILDEFGWERGMTAGVFSFGFLVSALVTPCIGWAMDLRGPRLVIELGVVAMGAGLILAALVPGCAKTAGREVSSGRGMSAVPSAEVGMFQPLW
jgi:MFS family permease